MLRALPLCFILLLAGPARAEGPLGYYRYPAIHGDTIVFTAEGDLWQVDAGGGTARRLTSHAGEEGHAAISPDGRSVAFSASYEGPTEAYVMPLSGGLPRRLTWHGGGATVSGFTPAGEVLYSTRAYAGLPDAQLVAVDPGTGAERRVPLAQAAEGAHAPDGTLYFTRFARQGSETKRYKGGTAQDVWRFREGDAEATPLSSDYAGTTRNPMVWRDRLYVLTDRDGTLNVWSMQLDGTDLRQHTFHKGWDVLSPDLEGGRIVYQVGADLWLLDLAGGATRALPITLASDLDQTREHWVETPMDFLTEFDLSPDGTSVALTARGEVFVAPVKPGRFVALTRNTGVRYRQARFLPDGKNLLALSDESGEVEWWKLPASGIGAREQVTRDGKVLRFDGVPSPDGKWIAHYDQDQELWLTDVASGKSEKLDFSPYWGFDGPSWSADSRWLVWSRAGDNQFSVIHLYNVEDRRRTAATSDRFDSWSATFTPDGKWLYFLSDRDFQSLVGSPWGSRQPEPFFDRQTRIYALALVPGLRSPFRSPDELAEPEGKDDDSPAEDDGKGAKKKGADKDKDKKDAEKPAQVEIEFAGLQQRIEEVPAPRGNFDDLFTDGETLFWESRETAGDRRLDLVAMKIGNDDPKPKTVVEDIRTYRHSLERKKLLVHKGSKLYVIDAKPAKAELDDAAVPLDGWTFSIDPREEWRQMFVESWRLERDYFYDRGMHGVDWRAMLDRYLPLVDRVTTREELSDLQAQMAGELSALHIFVRSGETREGDDDIEPASLGARLVRDTAAGGWRVEHVYLGDPDYPDDLSPLSRPGVDVRAGDVILTINGVSTLDAPGPTALLRNQAGKQARLRVQPASGEPRDVIVTPIDPSDEADLRYSEWEYTRRLRVDEQGGGEIGYVHLRAMGRSDIAQWFRDFYPVFNRKGLIVDVRHNRGGNIDSWVLARLMRRAWFYWQPRIGEPTWNMQWAFRGHMVALIDERTASDGEAFAEGFRRLELGPLIGTRTWGGEIWLTSSNVLVDAGIVTAAEFGVYGPEGQWLIEGHGVEPDVEVDNLPHATYGGADAQLDAAIEHLRRKIAEDPRPVPPAPKHPDLSFREPS